MARTGLQTQLLVAGTVVVAVGAAVGSYWYAARTAPSTGVVAAVAVPPAESPQEDAAPAPAPAVEAEPAPVAPTFDVVRVDEGGETLVAGNATPGAPVRIVLDDRVLGEAVADGDGRFAAFVSLAPSEQARVLSLLAGEGGAEVASAETVIINPVSAPPVPEATEEEPEVAVAMADPVESAPEDAAPEPVATAEDDAPAPAEDVAVAPLPAAPEPAESSPQVAEDSNVSTAPQILLADEEGLRVLQSPEAMTEVALDTITYNDAGEVSLAGRAPGDGFVRIYLDDQPITTSRITEEGTWRTALPTVDTGVYRLRVDEVDADGQVISRIETPFRREDPNVVASIQAEPTTGIVAQDVLTVQPGATLWAIARERYGEGILYVKVFEANRDRIRNPDLIFPGQVFDLPE